MLASVAVSAMPEIVASRVQLVIDCSQPDCTNKCTEAYGAKLIRPARSCQLGSFVSASTILESRRRKEREEETKRP
ncbi:uncharacterized protein J3R85_009769 [Psidium guajava]|nr:uncharacterized protein J3R85_009769 [Psidium guajava]